MSDKKTSRAAFGGWYRTKYGIDFAGAELRVQDSWDAAVKWLTNHSGRGGNDIYTMTADQLRARLIVALEENDRLAEKLCRAEDANALRRVG